MAYGTYENMPVAKKRKKNHHEANTTEVIVTEKIY